MDPAQAVMAAVTGQAPAAAPTASAPAQDPNAATGAATPEPTTATPDAATAPTATPETTPEVAAAESALALLDELGIKGEQREAAANRLQKALNDAKSKNGRQIAEENRRLQQELDNARKQAERAAFLEQEFERLNPLLESLKPKAPQQDPIKDHPNYKALIAEGYSEDQVSAILKAAEIIADTKYAPELNRISQARAEQEFLAKADAYAAKMALDDAHPVASQEVLSAIQEAGGLPKADQQYVASYLAGGGTPEGMAEMVYSLAIMHLPALRAKLAPKAPPAPAPGKGAAAPLLGASSAPASTSITPDLAAKAILEASQKAG